MSSVTQDSKDSLKKRVVHLVSVEKQNYYLENLIDYSDSSKLEFHVIAFTEYQTQFIKSISSRGVKCYSLGEINPLSFIKLILKTANIVKKIKADVIHTHLFYPTFIGIIVGKLLGIPVYVTRHHSDAIHNLTPKIKRLVYLRIEGFINSAAKIIIAPAKGVYDVLTKNENVNTEKIKIIPYGQKWERFADITPEKVQKIKNDFHIDNHLVMVCVARLYKMKGHVYLLRALSEIDFNVPFKLILVGDGDFKKEIENEASRLNLLDNIVFTGWRDDVLEIVASADVIVHPSMEDALSSSLIEALMLGKPIIATDISGARDTLCDGEFGYLAEPASVESLRKGIEITLKNLPAAIEKASKGKNWILKYMDAERVAKEYEELYFHN